LELHSGEVVSKGVLELALGPYSAICPLVTVHKRCDNEVALAVQRNRPGTPPAALPLAIRSWLPLRLVESVPVKFVVPDELQRFSMGSRRKLIVGSNGPCSSPSGRSGSRVFMKAISGELGSGRRTFYHPTIPVDRIEVAATFEET
jgi:hypothetical protein